MAPEFVFIFLVACAASIVAWALLLRYRRRELQHKERMAALERGAELPALELERTAAPWTPRLYLLRGMVWLFSGLALTAAIFAIAQTANQPRTVEDKLWRVADARRRGVTEEEIKMLLNDNQPQVNFPVGIALLGLIPAGVGLAYLVFYGLDRKNLLS